MKGLFFILFILLTGCYLIACSNSQKLASSNVEAAVNDLLNDYRLGGSVSVRGIQEQPQQNSATADLQFNDFQYGTTFEGGLLRSKDFKPKADSGKMIPDADEMFPQRKTTYSKEGKAILSRYNDGRWVLNEVHWGFDTGVKGTVEIR